MEGEYSNEHRSAWQVGLARHGVEVRAKDKLWERQRHGSMAPSSMNGFSRASVAPSVAVPSRRQGSAAPSIASAFGL